MTDRLLVVDGHNLLFQMFYGMPSRIKNKDGKAIQGTLGFVGALLNILRRTEPTHVVVLFDGEHANSRTELDANYKATRPDYAAATEEESPFSQLADICQALDFLHLRHCEVEEGETDDVVAAYAKQLGARMEIVIASFDSDFFQLITDTVSVLRYRGKRTVVCDAAYLARTLGITPDYYADFKSLTGDAADNIPGAEHIGPKTAAALIREFGGLEEILARAGEIRRPSVRDSVLRHAERLRTNYRLIRLSGEAGLPFAPDELAFERREWTTKEVLTGIGIW